MVQMSKALKMTEDMAGELFDKLDEEKKGYIERLDLTPKFSAIIGRLLILSEFLMLAAIIDIFLLQNISSFFGVFQHFMSTGQ
jgi:hypothetical protein